MVPFPSGEGRMGRTAPEEVGTSRQMSGKPTLQKLLNQVWAGVSCSPSWAAFFLRNSICCWRFLRS
jgi:hypothetical protein